MALSPDGTRLVFTATSSRTRLWAFPFDPASGRVTGEPYPITDGSTGEVDFDARADGSKVAYRTVRAGRNELWERSIVEGQERLLLSSKDWRFIKPRWSPDGAKLAFSRCAARVTTRIAVAVLNTDGSGERVLTKPGHVEMDGSDWSNDGQAILGACRFSRSERYSTCLVPVSSANEAGDPTVRVIASDPKRNLYNQRFSPDQRWISFLAHDLSYASTSTVYVIPIERWHLAGDHRRLVVRRQAAVGAGWTDPVLRVESHGRRERLGTTIRRRDWHADRRAISRHVVPNRAVPVDAADGTDGHRHHGDASAPADDRIAQ